MKFKILSIMILLLVCGSFLANNSYADGITKNVKFKKGMYSATYSNSVVRGDRDTYILKASREQVMEVKITSLENNAVFQILNTKTGKYLPGAGEEDDAMSWKGTLPSSGKYKIIVGGTRGNTSYDLTIAIL